MGEHYRKYRYAVTLLSNCKYHLFSEYVEEDLGSNNIIGSEHPVHIAMYIQYRCSSK